MLISVIRAPIGKFFDVTPLGRVLTRFSFDCENVDVNLMAKVYPAIMTVSWLVGAVGVLAREMVVP